MAPQQMTTNEGARQRRQGIYENPSMVRVPRGPSPPKELRFQGDCARGQKVMTMALSARLASLLHSWRCCQRRTHGAAQVAVSSSATASYGIGVTTASVAPQPCGTVEMPRRSISYSSSWDNAAPPPPSGTIWLPNSESRGAIVRQSSRTPSAAVNRRGGSLSPRDDVSNMSTAPWNVQSCQASGSRSPRCHPQSAHKDLSLNSPARAQMRSVTPPPNDFVRRALSGKVEAVDFAPVQGWEDSGAPPISSSASNSRAQQSKGDCRKFGSSEGLPGAAKDVRDSGDSIHDCSLAGNQRAEAIAGSGERQTCVARFGVIGVNNLDDRVACVDSKSPTRSTSASSALAVAVAEGGNHQGDDIGHVGVAPRPSKGDGEGDRTERAPMPLAAAADARGSSAPATQRRLPRFGGPVASPPRASCGHSLCKSTGCDSPSRCLEKAFLQAAAEASEVDGGSKDAPADCQHSMRFGVADLLPRFGNSEEDQQGILAIDGADRERQKSTAKISFERGKFVGRGAEAPCGGELHDLPRQLPRGGSRVKTMPRARAVRGVAPPAVRTPRGRGPPGRRFSTSRGPRGRGVAQGRSSSRSESACAPQFGSPQADGAPETRRSTAPAVPQEVVEELRVLIATRQLRLQADAESDQGQPSQKSADASMRGDRQFDFEVRSIAVGSGIERAQSECSSTQKDAVNGFSKPSASLDADRQGGQPSTAHICMTTRDDCQSQGLLSQQSCAGKPDEFERTGESGKSTLAGSAVREDFGDSSHEQTRDGTSLCQSPMQKAGDVANSPIQKPSAPVSLERKGERSGAVLPSPPRTPGGINSKNSPASLGDHVGIACRKNLPSTPGGMSGISSNVSPRSPADTNGVSGKGIPPSPGDGDGCRGKGGKGKSAPPPPPPPPSGLGKGKGPKAQSSSDALGKGRGAKGPPPPKCGKGAPRNKTPLGRRFHWQGLSAEHVQGTVFEASPDLGPVQPNLDLAEFRHLFQADCDDSTAGPPLLCGDESRSASSQSEPPTKPTDPQEIVVFTQARAQHVAIVLHRVFGQGLRLQDVEEFANMLLKLVVPTDEQDGPLAHIGLLQRDAEPLELMASALPTPEEINGIREAPPERLRRIERLMLPIAEVSRAAQRLKALRLGAQAGALQGALLARTRGLVTASQALRGSKTLRQILRAVAMLGSWINSSDPSAACGFALSSALGKLRQFRAFRGDRDISLLHVVAISAAGGDPAKVGDLADCLAEELACAGLSDVSREDLKELDAAVAGFRAEANWLIAETKVPVYGEEGRRLLQEIHKNELSVRADALEESLEDARLELESTLTFFAERYTAAEGFESAAVRLLRTVEEFKCDILTAAREVAGQPERFARVCPTDRERSSVVSSPQSAGTSPLRPAESRSCSRQRATSTHVPLRLTWRKPVA